MNLAQMKAAVKAAKELDKISLNIGRNIGSDVNKLASKDIEAAIAKNFPGARVVEHRVLEPKPDSHFGPFEHTSQVTLEVPPGDLKARTHALSEALSQDAIPAMSHTSGDAVLAGPKAEDWGGAFNKSYFVHPGEEAAFGNAHVEDVPFVHYSKKADLTELDPAMYGTGMKGAEAGRLADAQDIRPRSYFYVDKGEQTMRPESGVGGNKYTGKASGIYNLANDPRGLRAETKSISNDPYLASQGINQYNQDLHLSNLERAIKGAGYKGYHTGDTGVLFDKTPVEAFAPGGKVGAVANLAKEAFKAKFTPGFYHGSPANNIKAFDPNKGDRAFPTEGVTFVTRDPDFADSFLGANRKGQYEKGSTVYPVNVNLGKHFVPGSKEGSTLIDQYVGGLPYSPDAAMTPAKRSQLLKAGAWDVMEDPNFLQHLRDTGHDTFTVMEGGIPNVGIFEPQNIRGKFAKFNPEDAASTDFMKAAGGKVKKK